MGLWGEGRSRALDTRRTIIAVVVLAWLVWMLTFVYLHIYIPAWQREQAPLIQEALHRDCGVKLNVRPESVYPSERPWWSQTYPATGKDLVCVYRKDHHQWECTDCAGGP